MTFSLMNYLFENSQSFSNHTGYRNYFLLLTVTRQYDSIFEDTLWSGHTHISSMNVAFWLVTTLFFNFHLTFCVSVF